MSTPESVGIDAGIDRAERLNEDDQAARAAQRFLDGSLARQQRAAAAGSYPPGTCRNCGVMCVALAVYCDDDCRSDHERRLRARAWKA